MNTTTLIQKLLAWATEYEHKAAGFRLTAAELELEQTAAKHTQLGQQLQTAVKVRRAQRPQLREKVYATSEDITDRLTLIRESLSDGPKSTKELTAILQKAGARIGRDRVRQMIHKQMSGEVTRTGSAARSLWTLKGKATRRAKDRERKRQARQRGHVVAPRGTRSTRARNPLDALTKARTVAAILQKAGKPMPIKDLSAAARAEGLTGGLTGIANFIKQGFIKRNGKGYSFVAMPPAPASAPSASA